jgi:hypothetical protein
MKFLLAALLATTVLPTAAHATVRFNSGTDSGFIAILLSVAATVALTLLVRYALRRR